MRIVGRSQLWKVALLVFGVCALSGTAQAEALGPARAFGARACAAEGGALVSGQQVTALGAGVVRGRIRPAAQVTRNERADVTFELRPTESGGIEVSGRRGDLTITKTVQSTGEFVLEVATGRERVSIAVTGQGTTVVRGKDNVRIPRGGESGENEGKARRLLADSGGVLQLRGLAATLLEADDRSPSSLAMIMADATVGMLTGDVGAPRRIAQFLSHRANGNARPAAMALDCYSLMETRMVEAFSDYVGCYGSVYGNPIFMNLCGYRWIVQVESYWFGFISCTGFSW